MNEFRLYPWRTWEFARRVTLISFACVVSLIGLTYLHDSYIAWRGYAYLGTRHYYRTFAWVYLVGGGVAGAATASGIVQFKRRLCFQAPVVTATVVLTVLSVAFGLVFLLEGLQHVHIEVVLPMLAVSFVAVLFLCYRSAKPPLNGA